MDRKEARQIARHTFTDQRSNKGSWYSSAISFHEAANVLGQHRDSIHGGTRVFLANAALSIELLLKAIIVAKGEAAPRTHELPRLASEAGIAFAKQQKATLELLGEILKWSGRYPVPNDEKTWNHYYDAVHERHVIRERKGNTAITRANPETFPSIKNCEKLWELTHRRWAEIQLQQAKVTG